MHFECYENAWNPGVTYLEWKWPSGWLESWEGQLLAIDVSRQQQSFYGFQSHRWSFSIKVFWLLSKRLIFESFFPSCKWWSCLSGNKELHSRERIDCSSLPNLICSNTIFQYFEFSTDWSWNIIKGILYGVLVIAAFSTNLTLQPCYVSSMQNIIGVWKWTRIRVLKLVKW